MTSMVLSLHLTSNYHKFIVILGIEKIMIKNDCVSCNGGTTLCQYGCLKTISKEVFIGASISRRPETLL